ALINVSEAYFAMESKPDDDVRAETARLNLLPLEEQAVDLSAYEGAAEPVAWGGADEVLDAVLTRAFELRATRVEIGIRGGDARLWYTTTELSQPEALPAGATGGELEACLFHLTGLSAATAQPLRRGPLRRRVGERACDLTIGVERLGDDLLFVLDLAAPDAY
ncbi:MAG: hypothetical protein HYU66_13615, partial [Armatimonadetes bacterium]|nr:hypothetical protein [Armatimonadota bacterium]